MRNLLEFLARFGTFFLFLILEALSFFLIIRFDDDKNRIFLSSANTVAGYALKQYDALADFFSAPEQLALLQQENRALREQLANAYYNQRFELDTTSMVVRKPDSIYSNAPGRDSLILKDTLATQVYAYVPANVISNSINQRNNTLTIDRGSAQGVEPRMGVIGPQGIVGIVRHVSKHYAAVLSVLHSDVSISAAIKHKGYFGSLVWGDTNPCCMHLNAIPNHATVAPGDTVITSGFSGIFPAGIFIGTVKSAVPGADNFYKIEVTLAADLSKTGHVYVVQNKWLEELRQVQNQGGKQ